MLSAHPYSPLHRWIRVSCVLRRHRPHPGLHLSARPTDGQFHPVGQGSAVFRADGVLGVAVPWSRAGPGSPRRCLRLDVDGPPEDCCLFQPLRPLDFPAGYRKSVVPQGLEAEVRLELLAEAQFKGEDVLPVVGTRRPVGAGGQR